jgi:hypothetical protein
MREPREEDDQAIAAIDLATKLDGSSMMLDAFRADAEAHGDANSWFYAGLAAWSLMDATAQPLGKQPLIVSALDHLSAAIRLAPEHWPARFVRASCITMVQGDGRVTSVLPAAYSIASARADAQRLLGATGRAPYVLAAYCLAAVQVMMAGEADAGVAILRRGLATTDAGASQAMARHLAIPVVMALRRPELANRPRLRAALCRRWRSLTGSFTRGCGNLALPGQP